MARHAHRRPRSTTWIVLAALVLWLLWVVAARRVPLVAAEEASPAPHVELRRADGTTFPLAGLRGRVVLLNLWASWCGPCRREAARLTRLQHELADEGLVVLGLNAEGLAPAELRRIRQSWEVGYEFVSAVSSVRGTVYEGEGVVPHNWFIDRAGRIRGSRAGALPESALRSAARRLLDEAPPAEGSGPRARDAAGSAGEHRLPVE